MKLRKKISATALPLDDAHLWGFALPRLSAASYQKLFFNYKSFKWKTFFEIIEIRCTYKGKQSTSIAEMHSYNVGMGRCVCRASTNLKKKLKQIYVWICSRIYLKQMKWKISSS